MKQLLKWLSIIIGSLVLLILLAALIIPHAIDLQQYKPHIEKKVSEATGRPFAMGEDLKLSLFPWVGLSLSDVRLGNPPGFEEEEFLAVKSFQVQVKLVPLFSKEVQVRRFVLEQPRIVAVKQKDGRGNWEGLVGGEREVAATEPEGAQGLPLETFAVNEFAIKEGSVIWIDHVSETRKEITQVNLLLKEVSLDRPIPMSFSAQVEDWPLSIQGQVGPVGTEPGRGRIALDITVKALNQVETSVKGALVNVTADPKYDLAIQVAPFSLRELMRSLGRDQALATKDPTALSRIAFKTNVKGDSQSVSLSDGIVEVDQSRIDFSAAVQDFTKPRSIFAFKMDALDVDRYLAEGSEEDPAEKDSEGDGDEAMGAGYEALRAIDLAGEVDIGKILVAGVQLDNLHVEVSAREGIINVDPVGLQLYQGELSGKAALDVRQDVPRTQLEVQMADVQFLPILKHVSGKDFLEGTLKADVTLRTQGDTAEDIKRTLNGKGEFLFKDGAIVGINLTEMVQNVRSAFGATGQGPKPRTDFSEFRIPFTVTKGIADTKNTALVSPLVRVTAKGKADLVKEILNMRVVPKFVATLRGQGDSVRRAGVMVPVLVTGPFKSPVFSPDLAGMLKEQIMEEGIPDPDELKKRIKDKQKQKEASKELQDEAKDLLKGLRFGD
jgi:AsmA protein